MDLRKMFGSGSKKDSPVIVLEEEEEEIFEEVKSNKRKTKEENTTTTTSSKQTKVITSPIIRKSPRKEIKKEEEQVTKKQQSISSSNKKLSSKEEEEEEENASRKKKKKIVSEEEEEVKASNIPDFDFRPRGQAPAAAKKDHELWADKYAPQTMDDLVGAQTLVKNLTKWLQDWDSIHITKRIKPQYGDKSNPNAKAALLSGPPGIGKSTTARLVATICGRDIFELNASDTRSKKMIEEQLSDVVQTNVLNFSTNNSTTSSSSSTKPLKKRVIIMDEVDGMSSSDRGGIGELNKIIKTTKTPIICICNDYSKSSVRSLANNCYDLKFQRPQISSILKRMKEIVKLENVSVTDDTLEAIIKSSGNDIRQVLNALQMWSASSSDGGKDRIVEINKDAVLRLSHFDAVRFIFCESHTQPLNLRNEAFFADYDIIPLMISQNYVTSCQTSKTCRDDLIKMKRLSQAADAVCDADIIGKYVRQDQRWDLLTSQAILNIRIAHICDGSIGFPGFPEWLGKNSNATKRSRLLSELATHIKASKSATALDKRSLRMDYLPTMRSVFLNNLLIETPQVNTVIDYLDEYSMNRDDFFETLSELQFPEGPGFKDLYKSLSSQVKSTFTREYNKRSHKSQILIAEEVFTKKSKKKKAASNEGGEDGEEGEEEEEEEEEEEIDMDAFKPKKASSSSASKKTPSANKKTPSADSGKKKQKN